MYFSFDFDFIYSISSLKKLNLSSKTRSFADYAENFLQFNMFFYSKASHFTFVVVQMFTVLFVSKKVLLFFFFLHSHH